MDTLEKCTAFEQNGAGAMVSDGENSPITNNDVEQGVKPEAEGTAFHQTRQA